MKVKIPAINAEPTINKIFLNNLLLINSMSLDSDEINFSIIVIESPIRFGAIKANILAIIVIIIPIIILVLYLKRYLFKCLNSNINLCRFKYTLLMI